MPGPSKNVQGGYLGYSALTDSYWNTLNRVRKDQTQRLEREKLELENEAQTDALFQLPGYEGQQQQGRSARSTTVGGKAPTVVTNNGFSYTANINDPKLMEFLQPVQVDPTDPEAIATSNYRKNVSQQQKELFKGKDFSLDGSGAPAGGGFNSALQGALEGLKGEYIREGRRTSQRKRREGRSRVRGQLQALQAFSGEVQGLQGSYKDAYDNGLISYGTKSEFVDFLNTVSGPNDLQVQWDNGRGFLVGTSAAGKAVTMPLDNLEGLKNGLVLKNNNPAPIIDQLVKTVNTVSQGVDANGVKTENNAWTEETTNNVQNQLNQLLPDNNSVLSMGIDWLGFDGSAWKAKVGSDPEGSRQIVLDALASHVKSQHTPIDKGGLTADQAVDNKLASQKFTETQRHNRISEGQAQQRLDKVDEERERTKSATELKLEETAKQKQSTLNIVNKAIKGQDFTSLEGIGDIIEIDEDFFGNEFTIKTKDNKYRIDPDNKSDIQKLYNLLNLGEVNSGGKKGGKTPAELAAEFRARQKK